jgi:hypothetical protein
MTTRHILKTDFGVTAELELNEKTGYFNCVWEGLPKDISHELRDKILSTYIPWRNQLIGHWAQKTGRIVRVITL